MRNLRHSGHAIRNSLSKILNKELLIFLFFLVLSCFFWLMTTLNGTFEKELEVPVRLIGTPKNVVITTGISDTLRVTVRDKGFMLLTYATSHQLRPVNVNFNSYANKQLGHGSIPLADLQKLVKQQLQPSSVITSLKADQLQFYFNYGRKKKVRVQLVGNIVPAKNYYLSHVEYYPTNVTIYASNKLLDSIQSVSTEFVNIVNFDRPQAINVKLKAMEGVKIVPSTVKLSLFPDILTEESVTVPITTINKPEGLIIRTFPQHVKVKFTVGASMFRSIRPEDFKVVVDYKEVASNPSDKCNLYLKTKPNNVSNARLEINQVDYLIEQQ
jgi:hypothetical protein